jgi:hypothetical protein
MSTRVQVVLDEEERATFQEQARRESLSLSAWLRAAGLERLALKKPKGLGDPQELLAFFARCERQEGEGAEPDWEQHLQILDAARARGAAG